MLAQTEAHLASILKKKNVIKHKLQKQKKLTIHKLRIIAIKLKTKIHKVFPLESLFNTYSLGVRVRFIPSSISY